MARITSSSSVASPDTSVNEVSGRPIGLQLLTSLRPGQWTKNLLVFAGLLFGRRLDDPAAIVAALAAFVVFCLLSGVVYIVNDISDRDSDRRHPLKARRPIASGALPVKTAAAAAVMIGAVALAGASALGLRFLAVAVAYLILQSLYSGPLKHIVIIDVLTLAIGFVLRAVAGGVAAPVTLSRWFLLVVTASAVFVAAAKRYAELRRADRSEGRRRKVLDAYSPRALELIIAGATAVALLAYCMWAFSVPAVRGIPWRPLTIVPFAICLLRYGELVHRGDGEAPEEVLLSDRPLQLAGLVWLVLFALEVHAAA